MVGEIERELLGEIFLKAGRERFISLEELQIQIGKSGDTLRPALENLKIGGYVIEPKLGFQLSDQGYHYCRTLWV